MSVFRIVDRDGEIVADVDGLAGVNEIVRRAPTGRYHVDEISADPLPSGQTFRRWARHDLTYDLQSNSLKGTIQAGRAASAIRCRIYEGR